MDHGQVAREQLSKALAAEVHVEKHGLTALSQLAESSRSDHLSADDRAKAKTALHSKVEAEIQSGLSARSDLSVAKLGKLLNFADERTKVDRELIKTGLESFCRRLLAELQAAVQKQEVASLMAAIGSAEEAGQSTMDCSRHEPQVQETLEDAREELRWAHSRDNALSALSDARGSRGIHGYRDAMKQAREAECSPEDLRPFEQDLAARESRLADLKARLHAASRPVLESERVLTAGELEELRFTLVEAERTWLIHDDSDAWDEGRLALREAHHRLHTAEL